MKGIDAMKRKSFCLVLVGMLFAAYFVVPVSAISTRASAQIMRYSTDAKAVGNGRIAMKFSILGTDIMDTIGAKRIQIYSQVGGRWVITEIYSQDDAGMSDTDTYTYANTVYYDGTIGTYYKIVITVFAEDDAGSDSRTETHYVTA